MPFRARIEDVENLGGEVRIRTRLIEGAYFGPQYIRLKDTQGNWRIATITGHTLINPQEWPVTADHHTLLELSIAVPGAQFAIDTNSPIEGMGNVTLRRDGVDLSMELSNPLFWGNFSTLHMDSDAIERPYEAFLGLSRDEVNAYYTDFLSPLVNSETWPVFPLEIDSDRYVEAEWAGGA